MSTKFVRNGSYSKKNWARYDQIRILVFMLSTCYFGKTWIFSIDFRKISQISTFIKIHPVRSELFHANGGKSKTKRRDEADDFFFRNFANGPKSGKSLIVNFMLITCVKNLLNNLWSSEKFTGRNKVVFYVNLCFNRCKLQFVSSWAVCGFILWV